MYEQSHYCSNAEYCRVSVSRTICENGSITHRQPEAGVLRVSAASTRHNMHVPLALMDP